MTRRLTRSAMTAAVTVRVTSAAWCGSLRKPPETGDDHRVRPGYRVCECGNFPEIEQLARFCEAADSFLAQLS
jgi:hypothetical protein